MSEFVDYYLLLQLDPRADADAIKWQYRRMAQKHHPDHGGDVEVMKRLTEAYYTLSDPMRRQAYDRNYQVEMQRRQGMATAPVPQMVDIPDEVIDAIMTATLAEMAAATVRTAGRVAVAAGATAVNAVANTVDKVVEQRRLAKQREQDEVTRYLNGVRSRVDSHAATKRLSLSPAAKSWLVDSMVMRDAGNAQPPLPHDTISALDVWQLMEQTLVPAAANEARLQAIARPEYVPIGHCSKCDRPVRWTSNFKCSRCSSTVTGAKVAAAGSQPALEALYEQPETTRERVQRFAIAFGIIGVLIALGYLGSQSG